MKMKRDEDEDEAELSQTSPAAQHGKLWKWGVKRQWEGREKKKKGRGEL